MTRIVEELKRTLATFPTVANEELSRLQRFFSEMKKAGVAKTREYDIPRPDTIGRALAASRQAPAPSAAATRR